MRTVACRKVPVDDACVDLTVSALAADGTVVGAAVGRVVRGELSVRGKVTGCTAGAATPSAVPRAHVRLRLGDVTYEATAGEDVSHGLDHLPAGMLWSVSADRTRAGRSLSASVTTRVALDSTANPTAVVDIEAKEPPLANDAYEPDDAQADAAKRALAVLGIAQAHISAGSIDVDSIPFVAKAGTTYVARVHSTGPAIGDFALAVVDAGGSSKAAANATPGEYPPTPSVTWTADTNGTPFVRVRRSDDEGTVVPYAIEVVAR